MRAVVVRYSLVMSTHFVTLTPLQRLNREAKCAKIANVSITFLSGSIYVAALYVGDYDIATLSASFACGFILNTVFCKHYYEIGREKLKQS